MRRSAAFLLVGAASVASGSRVPTAQGMPGPTPFAGPAIEASGVVAVPGTTGALVVADGHEREVYWIDLASGRGPVRPTRVPLGVRLSDPEDITTDGTFFYAVASQSRGATGRQAAGLVRFTFDAVAGRPGDLQTLTGLTALLDSRVPDLARLRKGRSGPLNIEGLTFDRAENRLLLGLRSPMQAARALVIALRVPDRRQPLSAATVTVEPSLIPLDLGGLAIRGLGYDTAARRILIIGGGSTDGASGTYRLFEWSGERDVAPREVRALSGPEKPEGVTRISLGGRARTLLVFDAGAWQLLPE